MDKKKIPATQAAGRRDTEAEEQTPLAWPFPGFPYKGVIYWPSLYPREATEVFVGASRAL